MGTKFNAPGGFPELLKSGLFEGAQRAMGFVRSHAPEWQIDPHKIGDQSRWKDMSSLSCTRARSRRAAMSPNQKLIRISGPARFVRALVEFKLLEDLANANPPDVASGIPGVGI